MHRFTKLSLRALFVVVTAVCVGAAWVAYRANEYREQARVLEKLQKRFAFGYGARMEPAEPQWFWKPIVGREAGSVEWAQLFERMNDDGLSSGPNKVDLAELRRMAVSRRT